MAGGSLGSDAVEAGGGGGLKGLAEIVGAVGEGEALQRSPDGIGEVVRGLDDDGDVGRAGDVEAKLIGAQAKAAVGGLDDRIPKEGRQACVGGEGAPAVRARQIIGRRVRVEGENGRIRSGSIAFEIDVGQADAVIERCLSKARYPTGNYDPCQSGAILERIGTDVGETAGERHAPQAAAPLEGRIPDAGDAVGNRVT